MYILYSGFLIKIRDINYYNDTEDELELERREKLTLNLSTGCYGGLIAETLNNFYFTLYVIVISSS